jgi:hypothetical protein
MSDEPVLIPFFDEYRPLTLPSKFFLSTNDTIVDILAEGYLNKYIPLNSQVISGVPLSSVIDGDIIEVTSLLSGTLNNFVYFTTKVVYNPVRETYTLLPISNIEYPVNLRLYSQRKYLNMYVLGTIQNNYQNIQHRQIVGLGLAITPSHLAAIYAIEPPSGGAPNKFTVKLTEFTDGAPSIEIYSFDVLLENLTAYMYWDTSGSPYNINSAAVYDVSIFRDISPANIPANAFFSDIWCID